MSLSEGDACLIERDVGDLGETHYKICFGQDASFEEQLVGFARVISISKVLMYKMLISRPTRVGSCNHNVWRWLGQLFSD